MSTEQQQHPYEQLLAGQKGLEGQLERLTQLVSRETRTPSLRVLEFGEGKEALQVVNGELDAAYTGLAIFNPTAKKVLFDTARRSSSDTPMHVPAKNWLVWPVPFCDLTLAVAGADAEGTVESVIVLRLWVPPLAPAAGAWT